MLKMNLLQIWTFILGFYCYSSVLFDNMGFTKDVTQLK